MSETPAFPSRVKLVFEITAGENRRWVVRLFTKLYGEYWDKERARVAALGVAADAQKLGHEVEVWDRSEHKRLL